MHCTFNHSRCWGFSDRFFVSILSATCAIRLNTVKSRCSFERYLGNAPPGLELALRLVFFLAWELGLDEAVWLKRGLRPDRCAISSSYPLPTCDRAGSGQVAVVTSTRTQLISLRMSNSSCAWQCIQCVPAVGPCFGHFVLSSPGTLYEE